MKRVDDELAAVQWVVAALMLAVVAVVFACVAVVIDSAPATSTPPTSCVASASAVLGGPEVTTPAVCGP